MRILLSIRPEFAEKIFSGEKSFEFRKVAFRREVSTAVVYVTFPVAKIVGEFEITRILEDNPRSLWHKTKERAGISKTFFTNTSKEKQKRLPSKLEKYDNILRQKILMQEIKNSYHLSLFDIFHSHTQHTSSYRKAINKFGYRDLDH